MQINQEIRDIIRKRLLITLGILLFIRMGTFLPIPGINHLSLASYIQSHSVARNLVSTFSGDNTFVIGLFTLNIFPYINASIFIQLLLGFSPKLAKLQKEGGLEGKRKINRLTRFLTLIFATIQSISISFYLKQVFVDLNFSLAFEITLCLITGAMIILWLSEIITDYGLGNGSAILIYINIISNLPNLLKSLFLDNLDNLSIFTKIGIAFLILISLYGIVFLQEGVSVVHLISSKQLNQGARQDSVSNYIPLRFNQGGVMPIILTTSVLIIPSYISNLGLLPKFDVPINFEYFKFVYWIGYFGLILIFSSFYSSIVVNPKDMADQLQEMAVSIPGIRPGIHTTFYLKQSMKRVTLIGSTILATLVTVPNFIESTLNITSLSAFNTTSLLILAGVVLDLIREVKNIYYANVYNNMYQ